jgi:Carboxypeptidase regulatory-like domain
MSAKSPETLRYVFVTLILCAIVTLAAAGAIHAQSTSGIVKGTVVDPSNAAVPGANVRLENRVSGHVSEVTTTANGTFSIPKHTLQPISPDGDGSGLCAP